MIKSVAECSEGANSSVGLLKGGQSCQTEKERWRRRYKARKVAGSIAYSDNREEINSYRLKGEQWAKFVPRISKCGWALGELVGVYNSPVAKRAYYGGVQKCGLIWECPVCSAGIRWGRAQELGGLYSAASSSGMGGLFITLTLRHNQTHSLEELLNGLYSAWKKLQTWRAYRELTAKLGVEGFVRTVEITYGSNGWHPHLHMWLITSKPVDVADLSLMVKLLVELWQRAVNKLNIKGVEPSDRGVDVQVVTSGGFASYLGKIQESGLALELSRADLKGGRASSRVPFELLENAEHSAVDRQLWREYTQAVQGRRAFGYSHGLRKKMKVALRENDMALLEAIEPEFVEHLIWLIGREDYFDLVRTNSLAEHLEEAHDAVASGEIKPSVKARETVDIGEFFRMLGAVWRADVLAGVVST